MKLIYLIGIPGTGKSTIIKSLMNKYEWKQERVTDLLDTHVSDNIRVLGKYEEGEVFSGTDRLSMAVSPKAIEWLSTKPDEIIIGEGDRLNNKAFFKKAQEVGELHIFNIVVSDKERQRRYDERGSTQSDKFIQTVKTKCANIEKEFGDKFSLIQGEVPGCIKKFTHETPTDTASIVEEIRKLL